MLYKSLILGVLFSIGIFAVKSGVGIAYVVWGQKRKTLVVRGITLFALSYALIFGAAAMILPRLDPVSHLPAVQAFIQSGMIVHLIMAGLMMGWGIALLKHGDPSHSSSRGWLMLVLPCPVCITVILLSSGFLMVCFPDHPMALNLLLYLVFMMISLATSAVVRRYGRLSGMSPDLFLGGVMLLLSLYFIVSVTVMPQFADLDKVYRMTRYDAGRAPREVFQTVSLAICTAAAFAAGFLFTTRKTRSTP
ncbi:hypothetical protein DSCO28_12440 [Desulfosarcina ovata subsp. sediminis]|uniref:Transporter n=1 Tax=Desulfosarcina ovata subsp. sediminis TaxID=885957 RepID=A0A5K7ZEW1_9BACT|nr:DUF2162 domain-containing protein [Desulfosarcina ovata]BBO80678.1 hypothetical protein DSCO28_12440 [Desulfosarcina ovata subsp. sediminis]